MCSDFYFSFFTKGLSKWVRSKFQTFKDFKGCMSSIERFVHRQGQSPTLPSDVRDDENVVGEDIIETDRNFQKQQPQIQQQQPREQPQQQHCKENDSYLIGDCMKNRKYVTDQELPSSSKKLEGGDTVGVDNRLIGKRSTQKCSSAKKLGLQEYDRVDIEDIRNNPRSRPVQRYSASKKRKLQQGDTYDCEELGTRNDHPHQKISRNGEVDQQPCSSKRKLKLDGNMEVDGRIHLRMSDNDDLDSEEMRQFLPGVIKENNNSANNITKTIKLPIYESCSMIPVDIIEDCRNQRAPRSSSSSRFVYPVGSIGNHNKTPMSNKIKLNDSRVTLTKDVGDQLATMSAEDLELVKELSKDHENCKSLTTTSEDLELVKELSKDNENCKILTVSNGLTINKPIVQSKSLTVDKTMIVTSTTTNIAEDDGYAHALSDDDLDFSAINSQILRSKDVATNLGERGHHLTKHQNNSTVYNFRSLEKGNESDSKKISPIRKPSFTKDILGENTGIAEPNSNSLIQDISSSFGSNYPNIDQSKQIISLVNQSNEKGVSQLNQPTVSEDLYQSKRRKTSTLNQSNTNTSPLRQSENGLMTGFNQSSRSTCVIDSPTIDLFGENYCEEEEEIDDVQLSPCLALKREVNQSDALKIKIDQSAVLEKETDQSEASKKGTDQSEPVRRRTKGKRITRNLRRSVRKGSFTADNENVENINNTKVREIRSIICYYYYI